MCEDIVKPALPGKHYQRCFDIAPSQVLQELRYSVSEFLFAVPYLTFSYKSGSVIGFDRYVGLPFVPEGFPTSFTLVNTV